MEFMHGFKVNDLEAIERHQLSKAKVTLIIPGGVGGEIWMEDHSFKRVNAILDRLCVATCSYIV